MNERTILHSDCNSFYASVEEVFNPKLKNKPMAVCGSVENRHGIILAKNQLAKKYNICTGETVVEARRKCGDLILVEPRYDRYSEFSKAVNQVYKSFTDLVEPFGQDESWLDVSGSRLLFGSGYEIAERLRNYIKKNLGITVSVGVSYNKVFAKLGSDYKKPDAVTEITRENYRDIIYPLSVSDLFMVGHTAAQALNRIGIRSIGDLAQSPKELVVSKLGKLGETIYSYANGLDKSPVSAQSEGYIPKSVGNGMTFKRDLVTSQDIRMGLLALADEVSLRLRKYGLKCNTVQVSVKNSSFKTVSKQKMLDRALNTKNDIYNESILLADTIWKKGTPIRSITVTCTNLSVLSHYNEQIAMFEGKNKSEKIRRHERIDGAVDLLRRKYGSGIVVSASLINNDMGV